MTNTNQLQILQHNIQNLLVQKQQVENQLTEIETALQEIQKSPKAYRIIGKVMIASSKEELLQDLQGKLELFKVRLQNISKQEEHLHKKFEELQHQVVSDRKIKP